MVERYKDNNRLIFSPRYFNFLYIFSCQYKSYRIITEYKLLVHPNRSPSLLNFLSSDPLYRLKNKLTIQRKNVHFTDTFANESMLLVTRKYMLYLRQFKGIDYPKLSNFPIMLYYA